MWSLLYILALPLFATEAQHRYESPETCAKCHTHQYNEWKGSMMHYAAQSPVFQAFELTTRKLTGGRFGAHDSENPTTCVNCHAPMAASENQMVSLLPSEPVGKAFGAKAAEGVSCTVCHSVRKPDTTLNPEKGLLGDGIANASFLFFPHKQWVGPSVPTPGANEYHVDGFWEDRKSSEYLTSSKFCGSCHDVRLPQTPDTLSGEPFQRLENLFTEWEKSPYNGTQNQFGKVVGCTDCHMSLYGSADGKGGVHGPGSFPEAEIAKGYGIVRKHKLHAFTAVSRALIDDPNFPNQDTPERDAFGFPKGQEQRRAQMLRQACTLEFGKVGEAKNGRLPVEVVVTNSGAGHRVPSGFSQERQLWLELKVSAEDGRVLYHSGVSPEREQEIALDPKTFEVKSRRIGVDYNLRPFRASGIAQFNNAFMRKTKGRAYERTHFLTLASHIDNDRSLPILKPVPIAYEVPVGHCGKIKIEAALHFRAMPPKVLQVLAQREPALVTEETMRLNTPVEMKRIEKVVEICEREAMPAPVAPEEQSFRFDRNGAAWIAFTRPDFYDEAGAQCEAKGCALPSVEEYDGLALTDYVPLPGDNKDELWLERWTATKKLDKQNPKIRIVSTYLFTAREERVGRVRLTEASLERRPYFCRCAP